MIIYFSSTGNSRWAAETVAAATGDRLIYIPDAVSEGAYSYSLEENEKLGFIFPVHGWRPPTIVRRFIRKLSIKGFDGQHHYTYMIATAGDSIGKTVEIFRKDLAKRGLQLDSAFSLTMPESYIGLKSFYLDTPEKEASKIRNAEKQLSEYIGYISGQRTGIVRTVKGKHPWFFSGPVGSLFLHCIINDRQFSVDSDLCIKCGKCARLCPVEDIDGGTGRIPAWKHNGLCLNCFSCYHHCPENAIRYGKTTQGKGQYYFGHK